MGLRRVLVSCGGVFLTLLVVSLFMMLSGSTMRFGRIIVMFSSFFMVFVGHTVSFFLGRPKRPSP